MGCSPRGAVSALGLAFSYYPDKEKAWEYLIQLTHNTESEVKKSAVNALGLAFPHIPNKNKGWEDLMILILEKNSDIIQALGLAFSYVPDKIKAWEDLKKLMLITEFSSRVADVLGLVFPDIPDKMKGWKDLHEFIDEKNSSLVRMSAAKAIGLAFSHFPDKELACDDLIWLSSSDSKIWVRQNAINALVSAYIGLPDKKQKDEIEYLLDQLIKDNLVEIREYAYCTLGKISIYKATFAENQDNFKEQLQIALKFFEKSAKESNYINYLNPARFCLPFYQSFYLITFKKQDVKDDVERHIVEAKKFAEGSEIKEKLLEAIESLENALKEVHNERDFNQMKDGLIKYMQYFERTSYILDSMEESEPITTKVIKKGLPIIDEMIKNEIQTKIRLLCKKTQGSELKELGKKAYNIGQDLLQIRTPEGLEKNINNLQSVLSEICNKMSEEERGDACKLLEKSRDEPCIEDKIALINMVLSKISQVGKWKDLCDKPKTFSDWIRYLFEKFNTPATIASFVGFIILELFDIFPLYYNKHMISFIVAAFFFIIVFIFTRKKK